MNRSALCLSSTIALGALLLTGCSSGATDTDASSPPPAPEEQAAPPPTPFPDVTDCRQLEPVIGDFVADVEFNADASNIEDDNLYCVWGAADPEDPDGGGSFTVSVGIGEALVPDPESASDVGMDTDSYFTDPKLDERGGIGLWSSGGDTDRAAGAIIMPSLEIWLSDTRSDAKDHLTRNDLVTIGVSVLDL